MHIRTQPLIRALALVLLLPTFCWAAPKPEHGQVTKAVASLSALPAGHKAMLAVVVEIKDGFHAQSHTPMDSFAIAFKATPDKNDAITFGEPVYPAGKVENYPKLGMLSVYTGQVIIRIPIEVKAAAKPGLVDITGKLNFQACDDNVCYPPESPDFKISTQIVPADSEVKPNEPELFPTASSGPGATQPAGGSSIGKSSAGPAAPTQITGNTAPPRAMWVVFLSAFVVGIIFNVMPCVLPVLPLKAIGFYEVSQHNRSKSLAFGAVFSLGLIATFAVFGLLIFVFHAFDWGGLFTSNWFIAFIVIVLLGMAISTFGFFTVSVPTGLYNISPRHDTFFGNFQFGILTALLSTPCTFGMFVALLAWAISQPAIVGVLMLVTVGAGMASPYFLLSAMPEVARRFPRTGPWAELVKQLMGFLLLLAAVYFARPFLGRIVHGETFWWLPFAVILAAGIFLVVRSIQYSKTMMPRVIGILVALVLVGGSLMAVLRLTAKPFVWQPYSDASLKQARTDSRIVLIDFTADWCTNCQFLEARVLHSGPIVASVRDHKIVMLKADVTQSDAPARPLLETFNLAGSIPLTVIYSPNLDRPITLTGIYSKEDLEHAIELAARVGPTATSVAQR
jgi:thiol:disulfide interchange protein DsbD